MVSVAFVAALGDGAGLRHAARFQPEIQGMRALSVLAVVCAHAGLPGLPGGFTGVDVFFVISGFLITRLLLAEMAATGRIDLLGFWARRARRLLPNAYATLLGTVLLAGILLPGYDPRGLAREVALAALEIVNFHFAAKAVDYFQSEDPASPILHFWSLAVEEQFYIVWPVLLVGIGVYFRRTFLRSATILLASIACASCAACIVLTYSDQPLAYFGTGTRCWQLATGGLLAAGWQNLERWPRRLRAAMAWLGLGAILASVAMLDEGLRYPGAWALLPTLGAAALIAGFEAVESRSILRRGLSLPAMQWLGARSYSWYLWHWPLLVLPRLAFPDGGGYVELVAVPLSLAVACAAYSWIEIPIRSARFQTAAPVRALAAAATGLLLVIDSGYLYNAALPYLNEELAARQARIDAASADGVRVHPDCRLRRPNVDQPDCIYGDRSAVRRAVLFGDSHAGHWFTPLDLAAKQTGWQLHYWTKPSCPSADLRLMLKQDPYVACDRWRDGVMARLTGPERPNLVIMANFMNDFERIYIPATGEKLVGDAAREAWREGFRRTIRRLLAAGVDVLVIRDTPHVGKDYRVCLRANVPCDVSRAVAFRARALDAEVAGEFGSRVTLADFTDEICDPATCPAIRHGQIVFSDVHHLTATFAGTLAPQVTRVLQGLARSPLPAAPGHDDLGAGLNGPVTSAIGLQ